MKCKYVKMFYFFGSNYKNFFWKEGGEEGG